MGPFLSTTKTSPSQKNINDKIRKSRENGNSRDYESSIGNNESMASRSTAGGRSTVNNPVYENDIVEFEPEYRGSINWTEIKPYSSSGQNAVLGDGGFGTVVKALWQFDPASKRKVEVAVKVVQRSQVESQSDYDSLIGKLSVRVDTIRGAENKILYKDCIIRAYGICNGPLPLELTQLFKLKRGDEGVGIIMRLEKGGSLKNLIHPENSDDRATRTQRPLTMKDKINIIFQLARAIAELHSVGILHGDIKPENILLSSAYPPKIRLADFGYAKEKDITLGASSITITTSRYGTPFYNAPEMFVDPKHLDDGEVASVSRKTDIYSYSIVVWEILTEDQAFKTFFKEETLGTHLHRGKREDISRIPKDTPEGVLSIVTSCWDGDRKKRKSAIECTVILQPLDLITSETKQVDVLIGSCKSISRNAMNFVFHYFIRHGLKVLYEDDSNASLNEIKNNYRVKITGNNDNNAASSSSSEMIATFRSSSSLSTAAVEPIVLDMSFLVKIVTEYETAVMKDKSAEFENLYCSQTINAQHMETCLQPVITQLFIDNDNHNINNNTTTTTTTTTKMAANDPADAGTTPISSTTPVSHISGLGILQWCCCYR